MIKRLSFLSSHGAELSLATHAWMEMRNSLRLKGLLSIVVNLEGGWKEVEKLGKNDERGKIVRIMLLILSLNFCNPFGEMIVGAMIT